MKLKIEWTSMSRRNFLQRSKKCREGFRATVALTSSLQFFNVWKVASPKDDYNSIVKSWDHRAHFWVIFTLKLGLFLTGKQEMTMPCLPMFRHFCDSISYCSIHWQRVVIAIMMRSNYYWRAALWAALYGKSHINYNHKRRGNEPFVGSVAFKFCHLII